MKCSLTQPHTVTCNAGYPALRNNQEVGAREAARLLFLLLFKFSDFGEVIPERHLLSLQVNFTIIFDYNLQQVQNKAEVKFEAKR